ncbi:MAG: tetratricopeptide repeat protein [Lachnospiraceae bacterium]|nr:tetratricopeptide repeat protein [Lachnospiraceae bacterium]
MKEFNFHEKVTTQNQGDVHLGDNNTTINYLNPIQNSLPKIITIDSAPQPSVYFTGRGGELSDIKNHIEKNEKLMLINGMGGIGKSEICKKLFHEYNDNDSQIKHIGWVIFDENLKKTLYGKFIETSPFTDFEENFKQTKIFINNLSTKLLLFIDNMNEISLDDRDELGKLSCNIMITSRRTDIGNIKKVLIGELSEDSCISLYKEILDRSDYDDEIVRQIVGKAACLTLVVELLAKTAKCARLTDMELLEKLNEKGFNLAEIKNKVSNNKKFNEHLTSLFDLSEIKENEDELLVLKQFSLFPPQPLSFKYAEKWFAQDNPDILNDLVEKGWLIETETGFYMHPVISDVLKYENAPDYQECTGLVEMIARDLYFDVTDIFTSRLEILPFGEKVALYFMEEESEDVSRLLNNIGSIHNRQGDYSKALEWYHKALAIDEKVLGKEHPSTAITYDNIAGTYDEQGDYPKAMGWYQKALTISEKVLGKDHPSTAITSYNIFILNY